MKHKNLAFTLKSASSEDAKFVFLLQKITIKSYFQILGMWKEEERSLYFKHHFQPRYVQIIEHNGKKIGAISNSHKRNKIILFYILILPKYQNKGVGTFLLKGLIKKAEKENKPILISVLRLNKRARQLYTKLGFKIVNQNDLHYFMEYNKNNDSQKKAIRHQVI
ncbi:MAG: GNAT family N-acetyltransferase [Candidatus Lokiarchaeota archaeon]|nr:GNAT family N-acetyltransferase [Candidatus Lokiarchaeota archaeon]